jgi:lipopolysaccharide export system protein LptC
VNRLNTATPSVREPLGFAVSERPSSDVLFRRARRHSRRVRVLRVLIPVVIVAGMLVTGLAVWLNPLRLLTRLPVTMSGVSLTGTKMTMTEPKLAGYTRDGRRYELSASAAAQDITRADVVSLERPYALFELSEHNKLEMRAAEGTFDRKANLLTLRRDIVLSTSEGHEARLGEAVIDLREGTVISNQPVEVKTQQGTLRGNRLEVLRSGEVVRFDGGVEMLIVAAEPGVEERVRR